MWLLQAHDKLCNRIYFKIPSSSLSRADYPAKLSSDEHEMSDLEAMGLLSFLGSCLLVPSAKRTLSLCLSQTKRKDFLITNHTSRTVCKYCTSANNNVRTSTSTVSAEHVTMMRVNCRLSVQRSKLLRRVVVMTQMLWQEHAPLPAVTLQQAGCDLVCPASQQEEKPDHPFWFWVRSFKHHWHSSSDTQFRIFWLFYQLRLTI